MVGSIAGLALQKTFGSFPKNKKEARNLFFASLFNFPMDKLHHFVLMNFPRSSKPLINHFSFFSLSIKFLNFL